MLIICIQAILDEDVMDKVNDPVGVAMLIDGDAYKRY